MKTHALPGAAHASTRGGFTLFEVLTYGAILLIVSGLAMKAFFTTLDHARDVRRATDDITRALDAGERWRADVRAATAPPRLVEAEGITALHLPRGDGEIIYVFDGERVLRRASAEAPWQPALTALKDSRFLVDRRERVTGWRWEVELRSRHPNPRTRPHFAFQAVSGTEARP